MLISSKMNGALNKQVGNEFGASLQYTAMASHFASESLNELAVKFYQQADEEREHAMRLVKYIIDAGGKVEIPAIDAPKSSFASVEEAIQLAVSWEKKVTGQINELMNMAIKESDHISQVILSWFVAEQLEEVSSMENLLKLVQRAGEQRLIYVEEYVSKHKTKRGDKVPSLPGAD